MIHWKMHKFDADQTLWRKNFWRCRFGENLHTAQI